MNAAQEAAFHAGSAVTPGALLLAIAMIAAVLYLTWLAWIAFGQFHAWRDHRATLFDMTWITLRAVFIVLLLGYFLRP
jgi:integrating conjugative element protein (TIGR03758 family)